MKTNKKLRKKAKPILLVFEGEPTADDWTNINKALPSFIRPAFYPVESGGSWSEVVLGEDDLTPKQAQAVSKKEWEDHE